MEFILSLLKFLDPMKRSPTVIGVSKFPIFTLIQIPGLSKNEPLSLPHFMPLLRIFTKKNWKKTKSTLVYRS